MGKFYEFFAGGGMARAGLGDAWECLFANDFDHKKSKTYLKNWGEGHLLTEDIKKLSTHHLPAYADLVWGSFPCQDLSLAGGGAGLKGERSGTFWPFWGLMEGLAKEGRAPKIIVLENVCGTLTSHGGKDFVAICKALKNENYRFGALVIDAAKFLPHSRPRLFVVAIHESIHIAPDMAAEEPYNVWHTRALKNAVNKLPDDIAENWLWWKLPVPKKKTVSIKQIIEDSPACVSWHTPDETGQLIAMMSDVNKMKIVAAQKKSGRQVGFVYKRTRRDSYGRKVQRAEVRFDNIAGCLRTPAGGSSRQIVIIIENEKVRSRLISSRETARLMGLPDSYILPERYNEAYHLTGDGVVVPVVRHLAENIFEPLLLGQKLIQKDKVAA